MTASAPNNHEGTTARRHDELKGYSSTRLGGFLDSLAIVPSCHRAIVNVTTFRHQSVDTDAPSH